MAGALGRGGRRPSWRTLAAGVPLLAALVPPALAAALAARYSPNVPYKDQWGMVPFVAEAIHGRIRPAQLWEQVNEHRIPLSKILVAALAWWTRWDVRYEVALDFGFAVAAAVVLVAIVVRTVRPHAPAVVPWLILIVSQLTFSLAQGYNWTWGSLMSTYMATLAAAGTAWALGRWDGSWHGAATMEAWALAGALSFGSGMILPCLVPAAVLIAPTGSRLRRRVAQAAAGVGIAATFVELYFVGWYPRLGEVPPTFALAKVPQYTYFGLAYLGGAIGANDVAASVYWGVAGACLIGAGSVWLWTSSPPHRRALLPWLLLAAYTVANACLTAFGRLQNGLHIALLARYRPTVTLFAMSALVVAALVVARLTTRSRFAGGTLALVLVAGLGVAAPTHYRASLAGVSAMRSLDFSLRSGRSCLESCESASAGCLLFMCWDARVARKMCPLMEQLQFGLFAPRGPTAR